MKAIKRIECPTCGETFQLDKRLSKGSQFLCPYCEELLEVIRLKPITLGCVYSTDFAKFEELEKAANVWQKRISPLNNVHGNNQ